MLKKLKEVNYGSLATVVGRYYAMDRDKRWERIKIAYEALVQGIGETTTPDKVIEVYKKNVPHTSVNVFSTKVLILLRSLFLCLLLGDGNAILHGF